MKIFGMVFAVMVLSLSAGAAHAETLDDKSIKDFYAMQTSIMRDTAKMQAMLQERLADNYSLESSSTTNIAGNPPSNSHSVSDRTGTMGDAAKAREFMDMQTYQNDIKGIQYSEDRKQAYVTDVSTSSGTMQVPLQDMRRVTVHYDVSNSCRDVLAIIEDKIKFTHSTCDTTLNFTR